MPLDVVISFEDGTLNVEPNDLLMDNFSSSYTEQKPKHPVYKNSLSKIKTLELGIWLRQILFLLMVKKDCENCDPSKRLADVNSADNSISFE